MPVRLISCLPIINKAFFGCVMLFAGLVPTVLPGQRPGGLDPAAIEKAMNTKLPTDPATVMAVVNESKILLGDLTPKIEARIKMVLEKTQQEVPEEQIHFARVNLTRGLLAQTINIKRLSEKFILDQVSTQDAEKRKEASEVMASRARQLFFDSEVPSMIEKFKVASRVELDDALRKQGSSLQARQREFMDSMLGHMYMRSAINKDPKVSLAEINQYYAEHIDDYRHRAQARWEQMTVLYEKFPDKKTAEKAINEMGREAYFGGSMQAVARAKSQEPLASAGGVHEWTNQGSLASDALDSMLFSLPLNQMSDLIYDDTGIHIVRVLERKSAGVKPRSELQEEIEKKIKAEKVAVAQRKLMKDIAESIPVWSMFPEDVPEAKPLPTSK